MTAKPIVRDARTGEAMLAGTDVSVPDILVQLAAEDSIARVLEACPELSRDDIIAAVNFAIEATRSNPPFRSSTVEHLAFRETRAAYGASAPAVDALVAAEQECERVRYEFELITGIRDGLRELREGKGIPHEQVMAELRAMLPE